MSERKARAALDEHRVEALSLVQLHAQWARAGGIAADPQVERSARELVRLVEAIGRHTGLTIRVVRAEGAAA